MIERVKLVVADNAQDVLFRTFLAVYLVVLMAYDYWDEHYGEGRGISLEDRRSESTNPYYNQTESGLFLEQYYDIPGKIWTPWGQFGFWGSGGGINVKEVAWSRFLPRLGAEVFRPHKTTEMGEFGPIYTITQIVSTFSV